MAAIDPESPSRLIRGTGFPETEGMIDWKFANSIRSFDDTAPHRLIHPGLQEVIQSEFAPVYNSLYKSCDDASISTSTYVRPRLGDSQRDMEALNRIETDGDLDIQQPGEGLHD